MNPELAKDGDMEMILDMIKIATNEALKTAKTEHDTEVGKLTGGAGGLGGLF